MSRDVFILDAVRTPRGKGSKKGALSGLRPVELLRCLFDALRDRNRLTGDEPTDVLLGCSTQTREQGTNIAKIAALYAGWVDRLQHVHHVGVSPGVADGAALVLIGTADMARALGVRPRARLRAFATASVEPVLMLHGSVECSRAAMGRAGLGAFRDTGIRTRAGTGRPRPRPKRTTTTAGRPRC